METNTHAICPICKYDIPDCQCRFGGSWHPDRTKARDVALSHLYLLSPEQLRHIIRLEQWWQISYDDEEKTALLGRLKDEYNMKTAL